MMVYGKVHTPFVCSSNTLTFELTVVEILPYTLRAKGMALFWLLTGACGAFNNYVNPLGIDAFAWKFYFFYVGWILVQLVVIYIFFIEVRKHQQTFPSLRG